ncbi:DUF2235 domain-containing protein [Amycolatopsis sp. FDAARGOS 1241]|uniref:DUF2235 domain-containing protein n=1 Tax=Amycolatopsis sp. FDAARGOS 1241 TaxID=2778070 RepID=UPI00194DF4A7|nr:DUF2235 domain-containing protein [Amycolatopsis sp. FDAARGOS 1241]QRP44447.1 DUF2235 domain-containing protein [Amycolatopsis sp. FDAARGOS 1241]
MPKRIVICCDGTWDTADLADGTTPAPSNVTRLALGVAPADEAGTQQRVFYQSGVGTVRRKFTGGAFGIGLSRNVQDTYRFLVHTYEPGDEIFFVGFSRGAYTVRSVAGFIRNCGLLRREHAHRVKQAYGLYRDRSDKWHPRTTEATLFRRTYSHEPRIRFIGVWDTVGALGVPLTGFWPIDVFNRRFQFHDTALSSIVDVAFQALSIDERRKPFLPSIWAPAAEGSTQQVEQVWFAGCHADVGGGGRTQHSLADIPLRWLADHAQANGLALRDDFTCAGDPLGPMFPSRTGFFRLLPSATRGIGTTDPKHEYVASSAVTRHKRAADYAPPNLVGYLALDGPVIPVET